MSREECLSSALENYRLQYIGGDASALLDAIEYCAVYKLVMPDWAAHEFATKHRKWKYLEVRTLDEAFSVSKKRHFYINKERKWINKAMNVYLAVVSAEREGESIGNELFEKIASQFGINRDDVSSMYKDIRENNSLGRVIETTRKKR